MVNVTQSMLILSAALAGVGTRNVPAAAPVETAPMTPTAEAPALPASVVVKRDHTVVKRKPTVKVLRRGVVMKGERLPVLAYQEGQGCKGGWFQVHVDGWICANNVVPSTQAPTTKAYPVVPEGQATPWAYGFVRETTLEYKLEGGQLVEHRELQKGFGFGIAGMFKAFGTRYFRTAERTLIPRGAAGMTDRISGFEGMALKGGAPWPLGFVNSRRAHAYGEPKLKKEQRIGEVKRYTPFEVLETVGKGVRRFVRFDEGAWLRGKDIQVTRVAPLPKGVGPTERWIDVDTATQTMTAYEGSVPVYTTLISSGRFSSRTVKGAYRIWAKVAAIAMDNTDEELEAPPTTEDAVSPESIDAGVPPTVARHLYSLHDVPWTQFFFESYALHGVYWHDAFGNRKSHGCVNLSPKDAKWFYDWTSPKVPPGWWAIHATESDPGTLVRVR